MPRFLHQWKRDIGVLLAESNSTLALYSGEGPGFVDDLLAFLDRCVEFTKKHDWRIAENEFLSQRAECVAARKGIILGTAERLASGRREHARTVGLSALLRVSERLRDELSAIERQLNEARAQMANLVIYALENGVLTPLPPISTTNVTSELQSRWRAIRSHSGMSASASLVAFSVSDADALLLLEEVLLAVAFQQNAGSAS